MRKEEVTPVALLITRDGATAFVALGRANHVAVVDVASRKVELYILVGKRPWGLALSGDEKTLYVANGLSDDVTIIDASLVRSRDDASVTPHVASRKLSRSADGAP